MSNIQTDRRTRSALLCAGLLACTSAPKVELAWEIVPGQSAGSVTRVSSDRDLVAAYGKDAVESTRIELGEGETTPGTLLFGADSARRLEIIWTGLPRMERCSATEIIPRQMSTCSR